MDNRTTKLFVGSVIAIVMITIGYILAGPIGGSVILLFALFEGWTLINNYPNDTISEVIWEFSSRPMVPFIFGVFTGWALNSGFLDNPWLIGTFCFLQGHFFFQRKIDAR